MDGVRGLIRRLRPIGRLVVALALLILVYLSTVRAVEEATEEADARRQEDRTLFARGFAEAVAGHFEAGRGEVRSLAEALPGGVSSAVEGYLVGPETFGRDVVVVDPGSRVIASSRPELVGRVPEPCRRVIPPEDGGGEVVDTGFQDLVGAAGGVEGPVVSGILDVPGACEPAVAVAIRSGALVATVFGGLPELAARIQAASLVPDVEGGTASGTRVFLVDPNGRSVEPSDPPGGEPRIRETTPDRVADLVSGASGEAHVARYPLGEGSDAEVVGAYAPVGAGWGVVLEQDAALFDLSPEERPSNIVAVFLTVVFAVVFALLAYFDFRRRRERRRTDEAKNAFFSVAGHELRTPLTALKGFLETLNSRWDSVDEERRKGLVERMLPQARRLDRLIDRLLVAASIQAGTHTHPQVAPSEISGIFAEVVERYRVEAPLHTFAIDVPGNLPEVLADPGALQQVLLHLVDNAVKYSPAGGEVRLAARPRRRRVELIVEDEGVGLPSDAGRIFESLVQGESVTKRVHDEGGMGVGLFIVRTLVEEMDGSVRAERREPEGARFVVVLKGVRTRAKAPVRASD